MKAALAGCTLWLGCNAQPPPTVGTQASAVTVDEGHGRHDAKTSHVLLLSIDGFHDFDLANWVNDNPGSALASLVRRGTVYSQAWSTGPSDSFPATLAISTGGSPSSTGVYYDAAWDDNLSPANACPGTLGTAVTYKENINFVTNSGSTAADINPALLPKDPNNGCAPVYPHSFLKVNTMYEVIHNHGMRTAVADKHPSYEILNGPSGTGLDDFYGPEFNSGKKDIAKTQANDDLRVNAVLRQLDGYDHTGANHVGVPAVLGMNFQAFNIAQKFSGYTDGTGRYMNTAYVISATGKVPTGTLQAMQHIDAKIQAMLDALDNNGLTDSTLVIMAAKHGNSPVDRATFRAVDPDATFKPMIDAAFGAGTTGTVTADTMALIWLRDHNNAAAVGDYLRANIATFGGGTVYVGAEIDALADGQMAGNVGRHPDIIVQPDTGVVYTTVGSKICDHGGLGDQDRHVAMVAAGGKFHAGSTVDQPVTLQQVAPTVLKALGINRHELDAVNIENTHRLPDGDDGDDGDDGLDD